MKELNKELVGEIQEYFKKYKNFVNEKAELTRHNRDMKNDFVDIKFEDKEAEDRKQIKKEITKYFNTITEVDMGSDPVIEVRQLRKDHLDFDQDLYDELMQIYKTCMENIAKKEAITDRIEKEIYIELCPKIESTMDIIKGIFKVWFDMEAGKFPITLSVADDYQTLVQAVDVLGEK